MPLILIEGTDGSGKSTLAETILSVNNNEGRIVHLSAPATPQEALDACLDPVADYYPGDDELLIFDRAHWGNPVYGPLYRPHLNLDGYGDMQREGWRYAELFFESRGAITIWVNTPSEVCHRRCVMRGEDYIDLRHLPDLYDSYKRIYAESLTGTAMAALHTREDTIVAARQALSVAEQRGAMFHQLGKFRHYIGPREPELLIVSPPDRETRFTALHEQSEEVDWKRIGLASSNTMPAMLQELWDEINRPDVIMYNRDHINSSIVEWCEDRS